MFEGFSPRTIDFMWGLRLNNEKTWFEAHREDFVRDFQLPMQALAQTVFDRLSPHCEKRGLTYKVARIYRDARRLHGAGPYRDHLWFAIRRPAEQWTVTPVFWFELMCEEWTYGLGYYSAKAETMAKLRARIDRDPAAFEAMVGPILSGGDFTVDGPEYARKKPAPTEATALWYNRKSLSVLHSRQNGPELFDPALATYLADGMGALLPLYDFLATLDSDPSPLK